MGVVCLKETLMLLLLVGVAASSQCSLQKPSWNCTQDPRVRIIYQNVVLRECGEDRAKNDFEDQPRVEFDGAHRNKKYTIVMVDPDAPRHTEGKGYLHWIVSGVSGEGLLTADLGSGTTVMEYAKPTPPKGTGIHRYVTYVYEVSHPVTASDPGGRRGQFDLYEYARTSGLCGPVAYNMFTTAFNADEVAAAS